VTELQHYISMLRFIKLQCPQSIVFLPPLNRGLPPGSLNLSDLLETIAMNLEGKKPSCRKGARHAKIHTQTS